MARGSPRIAPSDLAYADECAADFLEMEEWPEDDGGAKVAAYREAARRLRRIANRAGRTHRASMTK